MPLTKQIVPVKFVKGIDTKSDPRTLQAGQLLRLENGSFRSPGRIVKRDGMSTSLGLSIIPHGGGDQFSGSISGTVSAASGIMTYKDRLLMVDDRLLYSYDDASDMWATMGNLRRTLATTDPVFRGPTDLSATDGCIGSNGLRAYWFTDPAYGKGGPYSSVYFIGPSGTLISQQFPGSSGSIGRVVPVGQNILHVWADPSGVLKVCYYPTVDPYYVSPTVQISPNSGSIGSLDRVNPYFDVCSVNTVAGPWAYIAWRTSGSNIVCIGLPASNPVFVGASVTVTGVAPDKICIYENVDNGSPIISWTSISSTYSRNYDYLLRSASVTSSFNFGYSLSSAFNVAGVTAPGSGTRPILFVTLSSSTGPDYWQIVCNSASNGSYCYMKGVSLAAHPFVDITSRVYVPLLHSSPKGSGMGLQDTLFLGDMSGSVHVKLLYGLAQGCPRIPNFIPGVWQDPADLGRYEMACLSKLGSEVSGGVIFAPRGVSRAVFELGSGTYPIGSAELGLSVIFDGGAVRSYDGTTVAEHGFHLFPEGITLKTGTGGQLSGGLYQYCAVYERFDSQGQAIRSSPSPIVSISCSASASVTASIPQVHMTDMLSGSISLALYRTTFNEAAGASGVPNFYRIGAPINDSVFNFAFADTGTIVDTMSDGDLLGMMPLYTNGGVIENIAPPSALSPVVHQSRVFIIDAEDPNVIWFSKEVTPSGRVTIGSAVEFSDLLQLNMDTRFGDCSALASLDDKLIIFKETSIFAITGKGPDSTGVGSFDTPYLVSADCGCVDAKSVVLTPQGIMFKGHKGIHLLSRGLEVSYVGSQVEAYNDRHVIGCQLSHDKQQVRFLLDDGGLLVYDYQAGQWGTWTGLEPVDICTYSGQLTAVRRTGQVTVETPGQQDDMGQPVKLRLQTGWIELGGIAGFQRGWRIYILGGFDSPHRLRIRVAYDHMDADMQDVTIDPDDIVNATSFGSDSSFGSGAAFGGSNVPYLFVIRPIRQCCTAIRIMLEDVQTRSEVASEGGGEGFDISAIVLEVGSNGRGYRHVGENRYVGE